MTASFDRSLLLPEAELPDAAGLIAEGRKLAKSVSPGRSAFMEHYGVSSEAEYKRRCVEEGRVMLHAQIGLQDSGQTRRACAEIYERLAKKGYRLDRFGFCFDNSMGYPPHMRKDMPRGVSLVMETAEEWKLLTASAPVACHFGDFVIGQPAAVENATMAIEAGGTTLGNMAQLYTYRLLYMDDDVQRTAASVKAIAMTGALPIEVLIHSNNDDGYGPIFTDLSCCFGLSLVERYIVNELLGGTYSASFGNMFQSPLNRMAYQRAQERVSDAPASMVYGSTTLYDMDHTKNRAILANYMTFDIAAQIDRPTGHALVPIPVTEYERIPDADEIVEVHVFANRLIERAAKVQPLIDFAPVDAMADDLIAGGEAFRANLLKGFGEAGIDTRNPLEMLLAILRAGPRRLESWFGPGTEDETAPRGKRALVGMENIVELERMGSDSLATLPPEQVAAIREREYTACIASTDVHEYGKMLLEQVMHGLDVEILDGGVNADPDDLAAMARDGGADFIALSTYNGMALSYLQSLRVEMAKIGLDIPVYVGGRLNQVPEGSNTSLPVDVSAKLGDAGGTACPDLETMLACLAAPPERGDRAA
jgi:methylmalonyl-CoA mutase cobalamin-binding subunit